MSTDSTLTSVILGSSAILAGSFFVNFAVDHRVIWQSPTEASVKAAVAYYIALLEGPAWLGGVLAAIVTIAVVATLAKLAKGGTSRILFDGGSLFLLSAAILTYLQQLRTSFKLISGLPKSNDILPQAAFGAISQIASANAIIAVTLTGVVALQGAQYYSERQIEKEIRKDLQKLQDAQNAQSLQSPAKAASKASTAAKTPTKATALSVPASSPTKLRRSPRKSRA